MSKPLDIFLCEVRQCLLQVSNVFLADLEASQKLPEIFESSEDGILSFEGMFSEEDLEGGLMVVFLSLEVGEGTGELVEVVVEGVYLMTELALHLYII